MTRLGAAFWLLLVLATGFTTFRVKYAVQDVEDELSRVRRQTVAEQQEIRVLTAEWTYLNQPERLTELNRRFLGLAAVSPKQLQRSIDDIPMRAPIAPPDVLVDASPETAAPQPPVSPAVATVVLDSPPPVSEAVRQADETGPPEEATATRRVSPPGDTTVPVPLVKAALAPTTNPLDALIAKAQAETPPPTANSPAARTQKTAAVPAPSRTASSLDALISQIADSR